MIWRGVLAVEVRLDHAPLAAPQLTLAERQAVADDGSHGVEQGAALDVDLRPLAQDVAAPSRPFADLAAAQQWVDGFVHWYNTRHLHSAIRFVTPDARHFGQDQIFPRSSSRVTPRA